MFGGLRRLKENISNLIYWVPKIWEDRQWDHYYFHQIMIWKLQRMENFFRSDKTFSDGSMLYANQMEEAKNTLIRINEDNYFMEISKDFIEKYWGSKDIMEVINSDDEEKSLEFRRLHELSVKNHLEDMDNAYSILRENVLNWWD